MDCLLLDSVNTAWYTLEFYNVLCVKCAVAASQWATSRSKNRSTARVNKHTFLDDSLSILTTHHSLSIPEQTQAVDDKIQYIVLGLITNHLSSNSINDFAVVSANSTSTVYFSAELDSGPCFISTVCDVRWPVSLHSS